MHTMFYTYLIDQNCPECKNEGNCPLLEHLKREDLFKLRQIKTMRRIKGKVVKETQNLLVPTKDTYFLSNREYSLAIAAMNGVCMVCQKDNAR